MTMDSSQRIAVIGAGISGLAAVKSCLEDGLEPVCLEKTDDLGGLWRYTEDRNLTRACVGKNTKWITCKAQSCFSDFPIKNSHYSMYLSHEQSMEYFRSYAARFDLEKYIKYNTTVHSVSVHAEHSGVVTKWRVVYQTAGDEQTTEELFDGVMCCTGLYWKPHMPDDLPGLENFGGEVIHSHNYRNPRGFLNKRVLIIGLGTWGAEIAVDLQGSAEKVYLSRGQGAWITSRRFLFGLPLDYMTNIKLLNMVPSSWIAKFFTFYHNFVQFDHDLYGLRPKHYGYGEEFVIITDNFAGHISTGNIHLTPTVTRLEPGRAVFTDGTHQDIDTIIFATGFHKSLPYLSTDLVPVSDNGIFSCYKQTFLTNPKYKSLAFIGYIRPTGSHVLLAELQSRWYSRLFRGQTSLPKQEHMEKYVDKWHSTVRKNRRKNMGIYFPTMTWTKVVDELSEEAGVKPSPWKYLFTDPTLALQLLFGAYDPACFRLEGPGKWAGAREAIRTSFSDMTSHISPDPNVSSAIRFLRTCTVVIIGVLTIWIIGFLCLLYVYLF